MTFRIKSNCSGIFEASTFAASKEKRTDIKKNGNDGDFGIWPMLEIICQNQPTNTQVTWKSISRQLLKSLTGLALANIKINKILLRLSNL